MNNKQLIVAGKPLSLSTYGGAVNDKGTLVGVRCFVAMKAGIPLADVDKKTFKEVKAMVEAKGFDSKQIKAWGDEYDTHRDTHKKNSRSLTALLASDPAIKCSFKPAFNKAGDCIGGSTSFRKERSLKASAEARATAAEKRVQELEAKLALLLPAQA